jgi:RNA polymerase sigma-70 factor (ECF subfamily)
VARARKRGGDDRSQSNGEVRSLLERVRPEFDDRTWAIFRRLVFGGCSPWEVARDLGCTPNAVYIVKSHVLKRLRLEASGLIE